MMSSPRVRHGCSGTRSPRATIWTATRSVAAADLGEDRVSTSSDPAAGHRIAANGLDIYYTDAGQGTPLVLLHGGTATSSSWSEQLPTLSERFRVLAPDNRGHGRTDNPAGEARHGPTPG